MPQNLLKVGALRYQLIMKRITTLADLRQARTELLEPLGLVPTMGYLHEGHLSLVRAARVDCSSVVVSIFVNPTQFGPDEDLAAYPRDLERDLGLLYEEGVDLVWTPTPDLLYPPDYQTWVTVENVSRPLEGAQRPGHMRGVATVVSKLFNAVQPDKAYFGQKDAQQVQVIRQMVHDLNYPIEVVVCPTVREDDGLAMSSRNTYLNPDEREAATVLWRALNTAHAAFESGERRAGALRKIMYGVIDEQPLARAQYVSCAHPQTLEELQGPVERALLSMAVYIGETRLIDNLEVGS
jgi:pantoate--beta-alanine ligase